MLDNISINLKGVGFESDWNGSEQSLVMSFYNDSDKHLG